MRCDHEFEYEDNWRENIEIDSCVRIPIKCKKCGLEAHETYSGEILITDRTTGEQIE